MVGVILITILIAVILSGISIEKKTILQFRKQINQYEEIIDKSNMNIESLIQWSINGQEGKRVADFLLKKGYKKIGIYGYGCLGQVLEYDLILSKMEKIYIIDRTAYSSKKKIFRPSEKFPEMDAIIITSSYYYSEINEVLEKKKINADIILIDDLLFG